MDKRQRHKYKAWVGLINSDSQIWGQYEAMVDFIFKEYPKTNQRFEVIATPLLFTISHAIELGLKENIKYLKKYSQSNLLSAFQNWTILTKSHDLKSLSKEFSSQFNKTYKKLKIDNDLKLEFKQLFKQLEKLLILLERGAETYRYANKLDNKGDFIKESIGYDKKIDFLDLELVFKEVIKLLTHSVDVISDYTDYVDFVHKHPQFKSGYKNHLWCQALHVGGGSDERIRERFNSKMIDKGNDVWFDQESGETIEMQIDGNFLYLLLKE